MLGLLERVPDEEVAHRVGTHDGADLLVGEHELGQGRGEVLECGGGRQVGLGREDALADAQRPPGDPLVVLGRVAELGQAVVEDAVLPPVHGLLPDEAGHLALERGVGHLVAEVAHRANEVVLAVGEHRRQRRDEWPEIRSPSSAKCRGTARMDSSKDIRRVGTFLSGLLVWVPGSVRASVAVCVMSFASRSADGSHDRIFERFPQILSFVTASRGVTRSANERGRATRPPRPRAPRPAGPSWQAAIARFGRDGYRATSVADIARDAGGRRHGRLRLLPQQGGPVLRGGRRGRRRRDRARAWPRYSTVPDISRWHDTLILTLVDAVEHHPLARRLLAGLEPDFTIARARDAGPERAAQGLHRAAAGRPGRRHGAPRHRPRRRRPRDHRPHALGPHVGHPARAARPPVTYSHEVAAVFEAALTASPAPERPSASS